MKSALNSILLIVFGVVQLSYAQQSLPRFEPQQIAKNQIQVVAINMSRSGTVDLDGIYRGNDSLLVLVLNDFGPRRFGIFTDKSLLHRLDTTRNQRLDSKDSAFRHLRLLAFSRNGKQHRVTTLFAAGIRAIILTKETRSFTTAGIPAHLHTREEVAIFADGSTTRLHLVSVPTALLAGIIG